MKGHYLQRVEDDEEDLEDKGLVVDGHDAEDPGQAHDRGHDTDGLHDRPAHRPWNENDSLLSRLAHRPTQQ